MTGLPRWTTIAFAAFAAGGASAADLTGTVTSGGEPVKAAFVTAYNPDKAMAVTALTDAAGRYRIPDLFPAEHRLKAHRIGYETVIVEAFAVPEAGAARNFTLEAAGEVADQLSGNAWLAALPDGSYKARFVTGCTICHDMGSKVARGPRTPAEWEEVIRLMREQVDIYSVIPSFDNAELAEWLADNRFGDTPGLTDVPPPTGPGAEMVFTEYRVGNAATWAHDMAVEPATGAAWLGDYINDILYRVDPVSGEQKEYPLPVKGAGMHTLHFDRAGDLWITLQLADMVARFTPATETWRIYGGFQRGSLIHSFAYDGHGYVQFDDDGLMWMSEFGGNAIASLDPVSGAVEEYQLGESGHTYGIAMDSTGRLWYTKYAENILGVLDPETGAVTEHEMPRPNSGPHRIDIDDRDRLWIPASGYGTLYRYDIANGSFTEYALPDPDTFPYSARFDGSTGTVWVTGNGADSLYRFHPDSETFDVYRMPSKLAYGRMVSLDYASGDVWTALSSFPNAHADRDYGIMVRLHGAVPLAAPDRHAAASPAR